MTETLTHTIGSAGRLAILSQEDLEQLDAAALEVLAEVGVAIPSERARAALVAQGATADGARVTMPAELVRRLVDLAPAHMTLGARAGAPTRHRRALAGHDRRLLRRDLRPRDGREARRPRRTTSRPSAASSTRCPRSTSAGRP